MAGLSLGGSARPAGCAVAVHVPRLAVPVQGWFERNVGAKPFPQNFMIMLSPGFKVPHIPVLIPEPTCMSLSGAGALGMHPIQSGLRAARVFLDIFHGLPAWRSSKTGESPAS